MTLAPWLISIAALYLLGGVLFTVMFLVRGLATVDPQAQGSSWGFRLLITPGVVALWWWLLWRWVRGPAPAQAHEAPASASAQRLIPWHWRLWLVWGPLVLAALIVLLALRPMVMTTLGGDGGPP